MIDAATALFPQIDFRTGDATSLELDSNTFEYVLFSYYSLDYISLESQRYRALAEIHRVVKPDGIFMFSSHNQWYLLPALFLDHTRVKNYLFCKENLLHPFTRYRPVKTRTGEPTTYFSNPLRQRAQLEKVGFELINFIVEHDDVRKYLEVTPYYVAQK